MGSRSEFTRGDEAAIRTMLEKYVVDVVAEDWADNARYYANDAVRMPSNESILGGKLL